MILIVIDKFSQWSELGIPRFFYEVKLGRLFLKFKVLTQNFWVGRSDSWLAIWLASRELQFAFPWRRSVICELLEVLISNY